MKSSDPEDEPANRSSTAPDEKRRKRKKNLKHRRDKKLDDAMVALGNDAMVAVKKNQGEIDLICAKVDSETREFLATFEPKSFVYDFGSFVVDCIEHNIFILEKGGGFVDESAAWIKQSAKELHTDWVAEPRRGVGGSRPRSHAKSVRVPRRPSSKLLATSHGECKKLVKRKKRVSFADDISSIAYDPKSLFSRDGESTDQCRDVIISHTIAP